jgi:LysR family transcriptional regulator for metE and metH
MELRHLRLIKILAEEGGITKSLERLYLTQSAVSHQLKDIEERIGTKVFHRGKNQWKLTEEGAVLYATAVKVLAEVDTAVATIQEMRNGHQGTIRLSTECYTTYHWLPSFMRKMQVLYPRLDIQIIMEATHKPLPKLLDKTLDLAITSDPIENKNLYYTELFTDEVKAVVSAVHPWAKKKYISHEDFVGQKLIIHSYPLESVTVYRHFLQQYDQELPEITAVPLTEATLEIVKACMGVTCMPQWALKPFSLSSDIRFVKIGKKGLSRTHFAAIRTEDKSKKHLLDFIENLKEEMMQ